MRMQSSHRRTIGPPAVFAAIMAVLASVSAVSASQQTRQDRQLREHADVAALAGVNAMAAAGGLSDAERADVAVRTARGALPDRRVTVRAVMSSAATMSVEVTLEGGAAGADIRSVAHYVQPGGAITPQQASSLKINGPVNRARL